MTKQLIVGAMKPNQKTATQNQKFLYDAQADWELSRLLTALDERLSDKKITKKNLNEITLLAETCETVLESQTESAEIFIQLAERALKKKDYKKLDALGEILSVRFPASEICEIIRQTESPPLRAIAFETLASIPTGYLVPLLEDSLYAEIALFAIKQQAYEYEFEEAKQVLDEFEGFDFVENE